jgi:hypothetical protein
VAKFRARFPDFHRGNVESKALSIFTSHSLVRNIYPKPYVTVAMEENYYRSLVEQELMMRSKFFLGSYYSSWSVAVWMVLSLTDLNSNSNLNP